MRPGESGVVENLMDSDGKAIHLQEMGLLKGTLVKFIRTAPLGDPVEIELKGYLLSLRKADAATVTVAIG